MKDESPEADVSGVSSPTSLPAISLLSPKAMEMAGCIIKVQEEHREKAKVQVFECFFYFNFFLLKNSLTVIIFFFVTFNFICKPNFKCFFFCCCFFNSYDFCQ